MIIPPLKGEPFLGPGAHEPVIHGFPYYPPELSLFGDN